MKARLLIVGLLTLTALMALADGAPVLAQRLTAGWMSIFYDERGH